MNSSTTKWLWVAVILVALGFAGYVAQRPMDFRVYYYGAQGVLDGTRPVYGDFSGIGWPMHYRYPPLFLLFAFPLTFLPIEWAAAIWTLLKCGALILVARTLWRRLGPAHSHAAWIVPLLLAGPYVVEDIRYGNAQSFIFALTATALLLLHKSPRLAAAALALGISIKVWPLYFIPYLATRREWKVVGWALVITLLLALAPAAYFGFHGNLALLSQWTKQEFSTQTSQSEIWFPSQSLRGVMMRYLTVVDYSQVPDSNYALVHVTGLNPSTIRTLWLVLTMSAYGAFLWIVLRYHRRSIRGEFGLTESLAFSTLILLEPFSQKYALVVLLWPAIVLGRVKPRSQIQLGLLYAAIALVLIQPVVQGASTQRLLQVLGFDFMAAALVTVCLVLACKYGRIGARS